MRRVMIVGGPGSGKTTLAKALGQALGLPVYHLDAIHLQADGRLKPKAEVMGNLGPVLALKDYILEGGYRHTYATRLAACDTLIWLDLPLWRRCWRIWRRERGYWRSYKSEAGRVERPPPLPMPWAHVLLDHHTMRADLQQLISRALPLVTVWHLRSQAEAMDFLNRVSPNGTTK